MWKAKLRKQIWTLSCCSYVYLSLYGGNGIHRFMNSASIFSASMKSFPSRPNRCSNVASSDAPFLPSIENLGIYAWKPPSGPEKVWDRSQLMTSGVECDLKLMIRLN